MSPDTPHAVLTATDHLLRNRSKTGRARRHLDPALIKSLTSLTPEQFSEMSLKDQDALLNKIRDHLLLEHGQKMLSDAVLRKKKIDRNDVWSYGVLFDKRFLKQESSQGLKAPQFFIQSLQVAIMNQPGTTISSDRPMVDTEKITDLTRDLHKIKDFEK